jgi:hypothetical protein
VKVEPCPLCGAFSGSTLAQSPALLAVTDVLVIKALEKVGKMLARNGGNRQRVRVATTTPWHQVHTIVQPTPKDIDKGLHGAWDVIPAMLDNHGCCGVTSRQVESMVDSYVRDLLITGSIHQMPDLRYRFERFLGIPLPEPMPYDPSPTDEP